VFPLIFSCFGVSWKICIKPLSCIWCLQSDPSHVLFQIYPLILDLFCEQSSVCLGNFLWSIGLISYKSLPLCLVHIFFVVSPFRSVQVALG
jgi:hypothetical protein